MSNYRVLAEKHLAEWMNNPYWAGYYREAPSQLCMDYIALEFLYSDTGEEDLAHELDLMEDRLELDDWKHLLKFSANGPERGKIMRKIREMESDINEQREYFRVED